MTVSGQIYFLGRYRPAHFEGATSHEVAGAMFQAIRDLRDNPMHEWLWKRIREGQHKLSADCTAWSVDHCDRGVSFALRPHDPWLDAVTAKLPPCPGLDYSRGIQ